MSRGGVSTCTDLDTLQYSKFTTRIGRKPVTRIQWDYRDKEGELHTGIATSIDRAMEEAAKHGYEIPKGGAEE
jgi:hypothetical protein